MFETSRQRGSVPFYIGRQRHAFLLSSRLGLLHYLPWWSRYTGCRIRCDVFSLDDSYFAGLASDYEAALHFVSIEYLTARLIERCLRAHQPLRENPVFPADFAYLQTPEPRRMAKEIARKFLNEQ